MGGHLSTPSPNPSRTQSQQDTTTTTRMSSNQTSQTAVESSKSQPPESETLNRQTPQMSDPKPLEDPESINNIEEGDQKEEEEEEEGECGFCLFMKGGGCREGFIAWEKCIEEAEKNKEDIVDKCFEVTGALKKCMEAHSDYYAPILRAEKAAEEEAVRELEKEKAEKAGSEQDGGSEKNEGS